MSQHCGRFRSLYESIVCFASIGILPAVLTVVLPIILTTASLSAAPQDTNAVAERMGNILAVKGQTLVITPDDNVRVNVGDRFEVLVALPGDLGEATVATGNVTSDAGGVVIGTLQNRDSKAKLATSMKIRFLEGSGSVEPKPGVPRGPRAASGSASAGGFQGAVERYRKAIYVVKSAKNTAHGTAFCISRKQRLLVTNAHVADIADHVVLNETRTIYRVARRWYHPDCLRVMKYDNNTVIRSYESRYGVVSVSGSDLAILQLEMLGPNLPGEVVLAKPHEVGAILGAEIGMYGYPGYDTKASANQFAQATFVKGSVSRFERLNGHPADQPLEHRRRVAFSAPNYKGFSGSPVFLADGRVVVVSNAVRVLDGTRVAYGIRVDALWDFLGHFDLAKHVAGYPDPLPPPVFTTEQNPQAQRLLRAVELVRGARKLTDAGQLQQCLAELQKAQELAPDYWYIYYARGEAVTRYIKAVSLTKENAARLYSDSAQAFIKADDLHYKSFNYHPVDILLEVARQSLGASRYSSDNTHLKRAANLLGDEKVAKIALDGKNAAYFLALRASVKTDLKLYDSALKDIDGALQRKPENNSYRRERQRILNYLGR